MGTSLSGIGLLYTPPSIWQMLRGVRIPFTGILSIIFLKKKLKAQHWVGMSIVIVGLVLVGVSRLISDDQSDVPASDVALGIFMTVIAQLFSAGQMVVEQAFVKSQGYHPLNVVGMEGLFGVIFTVVVVLPIFYFIPDSSLKVATAFREDSLDGIVQISNNTILQIFVVVYIFSIALFNFFGVSLTKHLTAVHRTLIDTLRTVSVWVIELLLYYVFGLSEYGEYWKTESYMELGGFALLVFGTILYHEVIKLCWFEDEKVVNVEKDDYTSYDDTQNTKEEVETLLLSAEGNNGKIQ